MGLRTFLAVCAILGAAWLGLPSLAAAQQDYIPLFVIERSINGNVVHYDAKLKDGRLDPEQPVVAYWVMAEDGRRQELNLLERMKAYGFTVRPGKEPESFHLTIVSDKKMDIRVSREGSAVHAKANIGGCEAYLQKIFIAAKKSRLLNLPEYAEITGSNVLTGSECHQRVTPADR